MCETCLDRISPSEARRLTTPRGVGNIPTVKGKGRQGQLVYNDLGRRSRYSIQIVHVVANTPAPFANPTSNLKERLTKSGASPFKYHPVDEEWFTYL